MNSPLQYLTLETGQEILAGLVGGSEFTAHFTVSTDDMDYLLPIHLEPVNSHIVQLVNGARVYRTHGRFTKAGDRFEVDVILPYTTESTQATIILSLSVDQIIASNGY